MAYNPGQDQEALRKNANNAFGFFKPFGSDYKGVGDVLGAIGNGIGNMFRPWSGTGSINWDAPSEGHPLGMINYRGPQNNQQSSPSVAPPRQAVTSPSNSSYIDDHRDAAMAGRQGMGANLMSSVDKSGSLLDDLLARGTAKWSGVDKSQIDYSPLDQILASRMGILDQLTGQTNQNFDKSDMALESMHRGLQNELNTKTAGNYNKIADDEKAALIANRNEGQGNLQAIKDSDAAKRQAMLKNLGIEASGATPDSSAQVLTDNQAYMGSRANADVANAEGDRASNLAFNQGIASSVGQAGVERRAALQQQLQQILGKIGMARVDAENQNTQNRMQMDQDATNRQYQEFANERGYAMDTANQMQDRAFQQEQAMAKNGINKVSGFSGLGQDLLNTGYNPQDVQHAMSALSQVLSSEYLKGVNPNEGYSQAAVIARKLKQEYGIPDMLAGQLATNYDNLGTSNSY